MTTLIRFVCPHSRTTAEEHWLALFCAANDNNSGMESGKHLQHFLDPFLDAAE